MASFKIVKKDRKKVFTKGVILAAVFALIFIVLSKMGIIDFIVEKAYDTPLFAEMIVLPVILIFMINIFYATAFYLMTLVLKNGRINFAKCILPIFNERQLNYLYIENGFADKSYMLQTILGIINIIAYIGGFIYIALRYGFIIMFEPHFAWILICYGTLFLSVCARSIIFGKILYSYEEIVPLRFMKRYYWIPTFILVIELLYFGVVGPINFLFDGFNFNFMNYKVMNLTILSAPFVLPVMSFIHARKVRRAVLRKKAQNKKTKDKVYLQND